MPPPAKNALELKLNKLYSRRENIFRRAQLCFESGTALEQDPTNPTKIKDFSVRYSTFPKSILEHEQVINDIINVKQELEPDETPDYGIGNAFDDLYSHIEYYASKLIPPTPPIVNATQRNNESRNMHMPKIELVKFDGEDLSLWPLFHENFKHFVHIKTELSKAEKLQYLLGSLTGKALKSCSSIEPVPENYDVIWKLLEDTYDDKKFLFTLYLNRLLNFRSLFNNAPCSLQGFLENFDTNVSALKRLKLKNSDDHILTHIAMSKLPQETINSFELVRSNIELPTYEELIKFVRQQSKIVSVKIEKPKFNVGTTKPPNGFQKSTKSFHASENYRSSNAVINSTYSNCFACNKGQHLLKDCKFFQECSHEAKFKLVKERNLCLNCFSAKHKVSSCTSKFNCVICRGRHHTLLHRNDPLKNSNQPSNQSTSEITMIPSSSNTISSENVQTFCAKTNIELKPENRVVLLSTVLVKVTDKWNKEHQVRFLIDSGSMSNLLTIDCSRKLGLSYCKFPSNILGIGGSMNPVKGKTNVTIVSNVNPCKKFAIEVLLIDKITSTLPEVPIDLKPLEHLKYIPLADPTFHSPGKVDGILGAAIFSEIMLSNRIVGLSGTPTAIETVFGYVVIGEATVDQKSKQQSLYAFLSLESLVERMFELENVSFPTVTSEDDICENLFINTVARDDSGRYTVALPFKDDPSKLGNSFDLAKTRLFSLEKRLDNLPNLRSMYSDIFKDYLEQGHMSLVNPKVLDLPSYYIPHHCIFKESVSTPCRIVFDASMKTDLGLSLNDMLFTGPKLQNNQINILLNFRLFPVAVVSDLKQMYRQVNIIESHRQYQRVLWRFSTSEPISIFQLNTLSFGVKSSPFLSLRVVRQICLDESRNYPEAVDYAMRDMYMDDFVSSLPDVQSAVRVQKDLVELFSSGGFKMLKWMSNSSELLSHIPEDFKMNQTAEFKSDSLKVLGLKWESNSDKFSFKINLTFSPCTKRNMLSVVAKTFDPLGLVSPITLLIKILIKELWELKLDWDQPAPNEITKTWNKIQNEFDQLNNFEIPRHIFVFETTSLSLVGFADASNSGYAAVVYARTIDTSGNVNVTLLCSQSKVTPMSKITLPRLELCAATLLAKRLSHIKETFSDRKDIMNVYAFSDSMITLSWVNSPPKKLPTFISNRVAIIQDCISSAYWFFVPGKENVSDCASRGLTPAGLLHHKSWISGPSWLLLEPTEWPTKKIHETELNQGEITKKLVCISTEEQLSSLYIIIKYFSSWLKMLNSTVYVLRFLKLLPISNSIEKTDLVKSEIWLIRAVQQRHFYKEYELLSSNKPLKSPIRRLNPFIKDGVIRVGGRLANSSLAFEFKHPVLLPKSDPFVDSLIDFMHKQHCHTGSYLLQALLRQQYWILSARDIVRQRVWKCNHCFKLKPKPVFPLMADLPTDRVNQAKAFLHTGVDFTGSFPITMGRYRGIKSQKAYICLFICLTTKAIHLELASALSTENVMAAFKRFLSRRGNVAKMFSDNGTNFVGSKRCLDEIHQLVTSPEYQTAFQNEMNSQKISWKMNAPAGAHFGGIWESNIKSVKTHLARVIGTQILSYEEFITVLCQIEALLNSRPLCSLSNDPNDPVALTPAHFLYSSPLTALPAEDVSLENIGRLNRYKLLDSIVQHYWK